MNQMIHIAALTILATLVSCTKAPKQNHRSSDCLGTKAKNANPELCGLTDDSANLTVSIPSNAKANESFTISWDAYAGASLYDISIGADEVCSKAKLEITLEDLKETQQKFVMTRAGTFYVCLNAKADSGTIIVRKTGMKLEITTGSTDPGFTAPSNLRISADSAAGSTHSSTDDDTTIYFIWDAATDATNGIKSYSLKYYAAAGCLGTATEVNAGSGTSYTFSSANFTSTYSFQVTALNNVSETKTSSCSNSTTINYPVHSITFDTPANYTYDNTLLSVAGGVATLLAITQTYDDNSSSEFGLTKAHNNTAWDTDHLELKNAGAPDPRPLPNDFYYGVDATGMILRIPLDSPIMENGDSIFDDFGHHGSVATGSSNKSVKGKHGRAFRSQSDYIGISSSYTDLQLSTTATIMGWVRTTDSGCDILKKDGNSASWNNYKLSVSGGVGRLTAKAGGVNDDVSITGTITLNDDKWHHVVGVIDSGTSRLYVNGQLDGQDTHTGSLFTGIYAVNIGLGCNPGIIDELAIFSRALSATEIATLYQNQVKNFTHEHWSEAPGLMDGNVLLLHMDETSGNLVDYSGLGNDGTISSGSAVYAQSGKAGTAFNFNNSACVDLDNTISLEGGAASYMYWVRYNDSAVNDDIEESAIFYGNSINNFIGQSNGNRFVRFIKGVGNNILTTTEMEKSTWYHITATDDGTTSRIYVNGVEEASAALQIAFDVPKIGCLSGWRLPARLDELAIWNRALSPQEIQTIYNLQSGGYRGNVHELPNDQDQTVDAWFPMNGNVLLMHMNETSIKDSGTNPTVYDYSGNGFNGTFDANNDGAEKSQTGLLGSSLLFDDTDDKINLGKPAGLQNFNSFSIAVWLKRSSSADGNLILTQYDWGARADGDVLFSIQSDGTPFGAIDDNVIDSLTTTSPLPIGTWSHVVWTREVDIRTDLYVNGVRVASDTSLASDSPFFHAPDNIIIGGFDGGYGENFSGSIDELAIWNRALTEDEIRKIYDHQSAKYSGTFTSDVIDTGTTGASWTTLAWNMIRPYGKELGTSSDLSSSYTALPNDTLMNGNVLLMHFNETAEDTVAGGTKDIEDFSSNDNHGTTSGSPTYKALGKFGYAMEFDGTDDYVAVQDSSELNLTTDFSLSFWVKQNETSGWRILYKSGTQANRWNVGIWAGQVSFSEEGIADYFGPALTNPNDWHHVAFVKDGDGANNLDIYVDGSFAQNKNVGTVSTPSGEKRIGRNAPGSDFSGLIDEVAIWSRALSASEVQELYRRGASRVRYKVRTCDASGCDDEPWIVPDNTLTPYSSTGEFFSELHNTTTSNPSLTFGGFGSHTVGNNQFFQWQAYLDTSDTAEIPELKSVTVGPAHYPGTNPTIVTSNALTFSSLISFTETSTTGTIKYQLSNDSGTTWYYYNSGWTTTTSGYTNSNTATDINTNIATFPVGSGSLQVKAFLNSNNASEASNLSNISISYEP